MTNPKLSRRPVTHQVGEVFDDGAAAGFDIETAGANADEETEFIAETEKFSEAETGIEMVACAGGDDGLGDHGALDEIHLSFGNGESVAHGMDDNSINLEAVMNLDGELA